MRARDQRGAAYPSPVVMLSIIAVAMAAVAFVATRGGDPTEREITPVAQPSPSSSPSSKPTTKPTPKPPAVQRGNVHVEVYNNSGITGLAGDVAEQASGMGWKVIGSDNWYGTIPASTVYFPDKLKQAAKQLALDLGIKRTMPSVDPMRTDRLTVILTAPLG